MDFIPLKEKTSGLVQRWLLTYSKSIAKGRKEPEKRELPELKILANRVLYKGNIKWIDPVVYIVQAKR